MPVHSDSLKDKSDQRTNKINKYGYFRVQSGLGTNDSGVQAVSDQTITVTAQSEFDKNYCAPTLHFTLRKTLLEISDILYSC